MYSKKDQLKKTRTKPTLKQMGTISAKVRQEVKERSGGICELCNGSRGAHMAHVIGRKQLTEPTTANILLHVCVLCHKWLDETPEGIIFKREMKNERFRN